MAGCGWGGAFLLVELPLAAAEFVDGLDGLAHCDRMDGGREDDEQT